jgi:hypothetical protein
MTITRKLVIGENGKPSEVIIPYDQFVEIVEALGGDLDPSEERELREAVVDSKNRQRGAFVAADEI